MTYLVMVDGYQHWTTSNGIRTFVGPVHHARTRAVVKARRLRDKVRRRPRQEPPANAPQTDQDATTVVIPHLPLSDIFSGITRAMGALELPTITLGVVPQRPGGYNGRRRSAPWWRRLLAWVMTVLTSAGLALSDSDWHRAVRQTAWTVLTWSFVISSCVVFGKGLLWVLTL